MFRMTTASTLLRGLALGLVVSTLPLAATAEQAESTPISFANTLRTLTAEQRQAAVEALAARGITEEYPYLLAMEEAAESGDVELLRTLIIATADAAGKPTHADVPLMIAVMYDQAACAELLLAAGAAPNYKSTVSQNLLGEAAARNDIAFMQLLISAGAHVNADEETESPLLLAIGNGHTESVEFLLKAGANPNATSFGSGPALHIAIQNNAELDIVRLLLAHGADANLSDAFGKTPLLYALEDTNAQLTELLLAAGASVHSKDNEGYTPLHHAAVYADKACVELLLAAGAEVNATDNNGTTPLHQAALVSNSETLAALLAAGAKPDPQALFLSIGARLESAACIKLLLAAGVELEITSSALGYTPLLSAMAKNCGACVVTLLEAGANPNAMGKDGMTPLLNAVSLRNAACTKALLAAGADANLAHPESGETPLHYAAKFSARECIELLLAAGADPTRTDKKGRTPHQVATKHTREQLTLPDMPAFPPHLKGEDSSSDATWSSQEDSK